MNRTGLLFILGFAFLIFSCDLLRDSPYEVEGWTPGEGYHQNLQHIEISLLLSHESDKARTEQAFSLTEDRKTMKGDFLWEASKLIFIPASPLESGRDYLISLGTGAQDLTGLSLESKFEVSFTTRPPGGKPDIIGIEPEYEGTLFESRGEVHLFFSEPVSFNSCLDHISFDPSTPGSWRLEDNDRTACFIPREPWQSGAVYGVVVDSSLYSVSGSVLGVEYSSVFYTGDDREKPVLLKALARFPGVPGGTPEEDYFEEITLEKPGAFPEAAYTAWENFTSLELVFSEPVDSGALRNFLSVEPSQALVMESPPEMSDRAIFRFAQYPKWGSSFIFRLSPGVKDGAGNESAEEYLFRISYGGPLSKPPALAGIRIPMAPGKIPAFPGGSEEHEPLSYSLSDVFADLPIKSGEGQYPYMEQTAAWIELYFETALETEIDLFSVMDLFRLESTNQALAFSPRNVIRNDFTWAAPREGWEEFQRVEIRGFITNTAQSGIVTFRIPAGLTDKRGNRSDEDFRISLLK